MDNIILNNQSYEILSEVDRINIPDCLVTNTNKIGSGAGEAKLYIGNDSDILTNFYGKDFIINCVILKKDLIEYMNMSKVEYLNPTQDYRKKDFLSNLWYERFDKVDNLEEINEFQFEEQTQIKKPRIYVKSNDSIYSLIREISLPSFSFLKVFKLKNIEKDEILYYFKLIFEKNNSIKSDLVNTKILNKDFNKFIGRRAGDNPVVFFNDKKFEIENKKLNLSYETIFDWGSLTSNSISLSQAILFYISNDVNTSLTYYNEFLQYFLFDLNDYWEIDYLRIKNWIDEKEINNVLEIEA